MLVSHSQHFFLVVVSAFLLSSPASGAYSPCPDSYYPKYFQVYCESDYFVANPPYGCKAKPGGDNQLCCMPDFNSQFCTAVEEPKRNNYDPENCPHNSGSPATCWADSAFQECGDDRQGAYDAVMTKSGDQEAMYKMRNTCGSSSTATSAVKSDGSGYGEGSGEGLTDADGTETKTIADDNCCLPVDNAKVAQEDGAVMGQPCTGAGACLLIEDGDTFSCEIDPSHFTSADICTSDNGIWCEGHTCDEKSDGSGYGEGSGEVLTLGASYCSHAPDYDCFEGGWPSCCMDMNDDECPEVKDGCSAVKYDSCAALNTGDDNKGNDINSCLCMCNGSELSERRMWWVPKDSRKDGTPNNAFCEDDDKSASFNTITKCPLLSDGSGYGKGSGEVLTLGASYCLHAPDYNCFEGGWPSCCKNDDECPEIKDNCSAVKSADGPCSQFKEGSKKAKKCNACQPFSKGCNLCTKAQTELNPFATQREISKATKKNDKALKKCQKKLAKCTKKAKRCAKYF